MIADINDGVSRNFKVILMLTDSLEHQLPIDGVEKGAHIEIDHPVVAPTALTSRAHGIDCRFARPVAVRIRMKHRLQDRFQKTTRDFLGNAIGNRWNAQRSRPAICFWNIDTPHRRWEIAPRRHSIPELVEVALKVGLEVRNRLSVYSSRSLVRLHTLEGFRDVPFGDLERLCFVHGFILSH